MGCTTGLFAFDAYSGQATYNLPGHTDTVWGVAVSPDGRWLLTGAGDHTMQIWNTARFEHVLSLFVAGDEWVAWTPQGYYAASLAGESLMGWQVNRGPDHLADFYPAAQFRSTFYRPDIVRAVLPTGSPHAALVAADATLRVGKQPITLAAALPPHVALKIVGAPDVSGKIRLETTAAPQGNEPIKSLQLLVDGRPAALRDVGRQPSETGRDNTIREQFDLNIPPGEHRVAARAETEHGHGLSEPADVTNSNSPTAKSRLFVLALGVDGTPANALARRFAAADAHDVASALTTGGKRTFGETFHYVLTNDQVNRAGYQAGFDWLRRTMRPADVGIVYLIVPVGKQADGRAQLLAADGASLGLAADELAGALRQTAGQLHLWLDAIPPLSASGDPSERATGTAEPSGIAAVELLRQLRQPEVGVSVLGAARAREISQERDDWRHGALAQTLLQGLAGQADADHDGLVRASELEAYVRQAVEQLTGGAQHPIGGRAAMTTDVPLARP
jgi:hypothetical protein